MIEEETEVLIKNLNKGIKKRKGYFYRFTILSIMMGICIMLGFMYVMIYIKRNDVLSPRNQEMFNKFKAIKKITNKNIPPRNASEYSKELLFQRTQKMVEETSDEHKEALHYMGRFCIEVGNGLYNDTLFRFVLEFETDNIPLMYIRAAVIDLFDSLRNDDDLHEHNATLKRFGVRLKEIGENSGDISDEDSKDKSVVMTTNIVHSLNELKEMNSGVHDSIIDLERQITLKHIFEEVKSEPNTDRMKELLYEVVQLLKPVNIKSLSVFGALLKEVSECYINERTIISAATILADGETPDKDVIEAAKKMFEDKLDKGSKEDYAKLKQYAEILFDTYALHDWNNDMLRKLARVYNEIDLLQGPFADFRYMIMQLFN